MIYGIDFFKVNRLFIKILISPLDKLISIFYNLANDIMANDTLIGFWPNDTSTAGGRKCCKVYCIKYKFYVPLVLDAM